MVGMGGLVGMFFIGIYVFEVVDVGLNFIKFVLRKLVNDIEEVWFWFFVLFVGLGEEGDLIRFCLKLVIGKIKNWRKIICNLFINSFMCYFVSVEKKESCKYF